MKEYTYNILNDAFAELTKNVRSKPHKERSDGFHLRTWRENFLKSFESIK